MPFICLARSDVPNGTVQILDLQPNSSQVNPVYGIGQTCYVNRAVTTVPSVSTNGTLVEDHVDGLCAYLLDHVEPGGVEQATGTVTSVGVLHGDTVTLGGVPFTAIANYATGTARIAAVAAGDIYTLGGQALTCVENASTGTAEMANPVHGDTVVVKTVTFTCTENYAVGTALIGAGCAAPGDVFSVKGVLFSPMAGGADPALQQFNDAQAPRTVISCAASLVSAINNAASRALISAAAPIGWFCNAVSDGINTVTITATARGINGNFGLIAGANITKSGATMVAAVPVAASQQFAGINQAVGGTNMAVATSLTAAINAAASQALITAVAPAGVFCAASTAGTNIVTCTASAPGAQGDFALAQTGGHVVLSGAAMAHTNASAAAHEFNSTAHLGTNILAAGSLVAAINAAGVNATAVNTGTDTATVTATVRGVAGRLATLTSAAGRIVIPGAALAEVAPVAASQQFAALAETAGGTNQEVAVSLRTSLTDAASIVLMKAASVGGARYIGASGAPVAGVLTMQALTGAAVVLTGPNSNLPFLTSNATRLPQDAVATVTHVLNRTHQKWTPTMFSAFAAAALARVDAGSSMTASDLNGGLTSLAGADLTGAASHSTGTVADFLAILSGWGYRTPRTDPLTGVVNQYMDASLPAYLWNPTARGGFVEWVKEYGNNFGYGEIKPSAIGGDWVQRPVKPMRYIADTDSFKLSVAGGALATFGDVAGMPPVTLFPDSDPVPFYSTLFQPTLQYPTVHNARLVTVYDDAGNVLA